MSATAQNNKFSIEDSFSKCKQIQRKFCICSHLLKKSFTSFFCAVYCAVYDTLLKLEDCCIVMEYQVHMTNSFIVMIIWWKNIFQFKKHEFLCHWKVDDANLNCSVPLIWEKKIFQIMRLFLESKIVPVWIVLFTWFCVLFFIVEDLLGSIV